MYIVQGKLVSEDLLKEQFTCNLAACKGACCWEGDFGAPLEEEEIEGLRKILPVLEPFLSEEGKAIIEKQGVSVFYPDNGNNGTPLADNGACVYMVLGPEGTAQCGIEKAWKEGLTDFRKPVSCHLYPVRVVRNPQVDFVALNYDRWDICSPACSMGKELKMPVYQFVREALLSKFGKTFVKELDLLANREASKPDHPG